MNGNSIKQLSSAFFLASERCLTEKNDGEICQSIILVPGIVCLAFSIELGLKAILALQDQPTKGHNIFELFSKISPEKQLQIIERIGLGKDEFDIKLKKAADVFTQWRYVYEHEQVEASLGFLDNLARSVQNLTES